MPKKRERTKSSPCEQTKKQKPNQFIADGSFVEETESWEENSIYIPHTPELDLTMTKILSREDLKELVSILGKELKADLIESIKTELKAEIKSELRSEIIKEVQEAVDSETLSLRNELSSLKKAHAELQQASLDNFLATDEVEQYSRRLCLDISGIPGDTNDPNENVTGKILSHFKNWKSSEGTTLEIDPSDILVSHRKGKFKEGFSVNRKCIVKFSNHAACQRVYNARKDLGSGIFVQQNITPYREKLSYEARQLIRAKTLQKTWISGFKVFAQFPTTTNPMTGKSEQGAKVHIKSMRTIEAIKDGSIFKS
jgi:hypothetical protein